VAVLTVVGVGVAAVVVGLRTGQHTARPSPSGPVTASTAVTVNRGTLVYSDDFRDSSSGWTTDTLASGTTFRYTSAGYVVAAKGNLDHYAFAPYALPLQQASMSVTATQSNDAPTGAGFGVSCRRGTGTSEIRYDFLVTTGGDWLIERRNGGLTTAPAILKQGSSSATPGSSSLTVRGMCVTLSDLHTTRLILFADTKKIADFADTGAALPDIGWQTALIVTSDASHPSVVTATRFEVRDLSS
jgi:hypothetical protein